jgi:hypothetical protein
MHAAVTAQSHCAAVARHVSCRFAAGSKAISGNFYFRLFTVIGIIKIQDAERSVLWLSRPCSGP